MAAKAQNLPIGGHKERVIRLSLRIAEQLLRIAKIRENRSHFP
jgi:hypothetical protein